MNDPHTAISSSGVSSVMDILDGLPAKNQPADSHLPEITTRLAANPDLCSFLRFLNENKLWDFVHPYRPDGKTAFRTYLEHFQPLIAHRPVYVHRGGIMVYFPPKSPDLVSQPLLPYRPLPEWMEEVKFLHQEWFSDDIFHDGWMGRYYRQSPLVTPLMIETYLNGETP